MAELEPRKDPENYTPMFPKIRTQPQTAAVPQCTVDSGFVVLAPANGQCICPPGTFQPGSPPTPFNGSLVYFSPN